MNKTEKYSMGMTYTDTQRYRQTRLIRLHALRQKNIRNASEASKALTRTSTRNCFSIIFLVGESSMRDEIRDTVRRSRQARTHAHTHTNAQTQTCKTECDITVWMIVAVAGPIPRLSQG